MVNALVCGTRDFKNLSALSQSKNVIDNTRRTQYMLPAMILDEVSSEFTLEEIKYSKVN